MLKKNILYISLLINLLLLVGIFYGINRYGGWNNLWAKVNNRGISKTYLHRKNLFEMLPNRDSGIVFLGNSLTAQGEWAELLQDERILNRGIPGDHCDGVGERLSEIVRLKPRQIFLMIGVNDLAYHPSSTVLSKYRTLVERILEQMPETQLLLEAVFPVNNKVSPSPVSNEEVLELNAGIRRLADEHGLTFLNTHSILLDEDGRLDAKYTLDGIHLNGEAYQKWSRFLSPHLIEN